MLGTGNRYTIVVPDKRAEDSLVNVGIAVRRWRAHRSSHSSPGGAWAVSHAGSAHTWPPPGPVTPTPCPTAAEADLPPATSRTTLRFSCRDNAHWTLPLVVYPLQRGPFIQGRRCPLSGRESVSSKSGRDGEEARATRGVHEASLPCACAREELLERSPGRGSGRCQPPDHEHSGACAHPP